MAGIYIHIPFCESRCIYCDFYSTTSLKWKDDYVDALCKEMELRPAIQALGDNYPKQDQSQIHPFSGIKEIPE